MSRDSLIKWRDIFHGEDQEEWQAWQDIDFESDVVEMLCRRYRLGSRERLKLIQKPYTGDSDPRYSLERFYEQCPTFPVRLFTRTYPNIVKNNPVHRLIIDFENRPFVKDFLAIKEKVPTASICGLVFPWQGIDPVCKGKSALVISNLNCSREPGVQVRFTFGNGTQLYLAAIENVLNAIDAMPPTRRAT